MAQSAAAQKIQRGYYNYNIYNGIPSNHVYQVIIDTFGYVWIATTKGVLKYNGYTFKKFGFEEGLAKEDVWCLVEDDSNKVWLGSITNSFGYIQNNTFVPVVKNSVIPVYPHQLQKINNGITFFPDSVARLLSIRVDVGYRIQNGKVRKFVIDSKDIPSRNLTFDAEGALYELRNGVITRRVNAEGKVVNEKVCKTSIPTDFLDTTQGVNWNSFKYFIRYVPARNSFYFIEIKTGLVTPYYDKLNPSESWLAIHPSNKFFHLVSNKRAIVLDELLNHRYTYHLNEMMPVEDTAEASFVWHIKNAFWCGFTTTANMGMYQHFTKFPGKKLPIERMSGVKYVGKTLNASTSFWWNNATHELICINQNGRVNRKVHADIFDVIGVKSFPGMGSFMYSKYKFSKIDEHTGEMKSFMDQFKWYYNPECFKDAVPINGRYHYLSILQIQDVYMYKDTLYARSGSGNLLYKNYKHNDTFKAFAGNRIVGKINVVDTVSKIMYVSLPDWFLTDNIFTGRRDSVSASILKKLGIDGITMLAVDNKTSSLFILAKTGLFVFNTRKFWLKKLPLCLNTTECNMQLYNDNLVLNSSYGLVFYKLFATGEVSKPYYVVNYKYSHYKYLYGSDFFVGDSTVLFNTDNGLMSVPIPDDSLYKYNTSNPAFKLTVTYKGQLRQLNAGDTLLMDQRNPIYLFDIINPMGVGTPRFYYYVPGLSDTWQQLNGAEWFALGLKPESYNKVYIKVLDEGWVSTPRAFYVYVSPYWWQTLSGKVIIGLCLLVLIGGIAFGVMRITRNRINRVNARKNLEAELKSLRTSMELKSIHAQINPHFIFNTLSTGLYFIKKNKMEDAYDHIAAFSELLRNYIKSSRDKYIVLNEEIDNLKRYVSLQQSRFENLHEFDVEIAEGVNVFVEKIPALLLQPLVENAINHGLFHKSTPGRLLLRFEKNASGDLICIIDDDGVGREKSKAINAETRHKTQSYGTDLVRELIEAFNKYEPVNITIEYIDKQPPLSGTTVVLTIKEVKDDNK
ncbi:MAG: histidine kinase [Flavipsychrobacter sp.]